MILIALPMNIKKKNSSKSFDKKFGQKRESVKIVIPAIVTPFACTAHTHTLSLTFTHFHTRCGCLFSCWCPLLGFAPHSRKQLIASPTILVALTCAAPRTSTQGRHTISVTRVMSSARQRVSAAANTAAGGDASVMLWLAVSFGLLYFLSIFGVIFCYYLDMGPFIFALLTLTGP